MLSCLMVTLYMYMYVSTDVEDYQSIGTVNLIFSSTTTLIGTTTFIVNDNIDELEEFFSASLNLVTVRPNIIVSPAEATVAILDDDGMCVRNILHNHIMKLYAESSSKQAPSR